MQGDSKSVALCVALGGSSDIIGVVVLARAAGYGRVVLLQPGSPAKGSAHTSSVQCSRVEPQSPPLVAPGGGYYDNGSMVAYLLAVLPEAEAGYYLTQPKDDVGGGFSRAALDASIEAITQLGADHGCTAVLGVDLGGDAALERSAPSDCAPFIPERDRLNLRAARSAAKRLGLAHLLVAISPGIDAAAVTPDYAQRQQAVDGGNVRVVELGTDGVMCDVAPPAPVCSLPVLPAALFETRHISLEGCYSELLRPLADRIIADCPPDKRKEHHSKTYCLMSAISVEIERIKLDGSSADFFALGQFRSIEKARAHLHSSTALGIFDLAGFHMHNDDT